MRSLRYNKLTFVFGPKQPLSWFLLCATSIIALLKIFGTSSPNTLDSVNPSIVLRIDMNYRRLKEPEAKTPERFDLRSLLQDELQACSKYREHYVPCYNVSANLLAGFKDGDEFDRHCNVSRQEEERCLIRPPKDYKVPLRWPAGRDVIWSGNVKMTKDQFLSSGTMNKRMMLLEENQITYHFEDDFMVDDIKDYSWKIAEMIGLGSDSEFLQAGVRTVLDIGCGFVSFTAHLMSLNLMAICISPYEANGSQVQLALERGLPAMLGSFILRKLPYPSLSFGMVHCAQCGIFLAFWCLHQTDGKLLLEVDRILKPGGFFVLTSPTSKPKGNSLEKKRSISTTAEQLAEKICWSLVAQQDGSFIWQKTADPNCYSSRKQDSVPLCRDEDDTVTYYSPLESCIYGTSCKRWIPIQNRSSTSDLSSSELEVYGIRADQFYEDMQACRLALNNYWSLLTPLIFSDHPKRPGDEDPLPPFNMFRNVMDMNAHYGNLNSAFLEDGKTVWVMNVVPVSAQNTLPLILDRGFAGAVHNWCEPFPTYPRTYDMIHANGLLSQLFLERCSMTDLFLEMDRILRPEGWAVISDELGVIEIAQGVAGQLHWEARVIHLQNGSNQRLLVCQKPFLRKAF